MEEEVEAEDKIAEEVEDEQELKKEEKKKVGEVRKDE